ncbi:GNAT family N-acetyltransferase [Kribbella albertanoniae]|uniref:GNAT family N-acetyltransferase n=1 Tax=Kribbella albertanoniae TaxID=1266829 RepID=UPI001EDE4B48|nr:GNAT family N-acetyltransferase [Kribbella albertanoniae]
MTWPEGIVARPITPGDVQAWADLLAARELVDQGGENYEAADLLEELADPHLDTEQATIGLWSGEQMVGYAKLHPRTSVVDVDRVDAEGTVHPEWRRRGVGAALMRWTIRGAGEQHAATFPDYPGEVRASAKSTHDGTIAMLRGLGFEEARYFYDMKRELDEPVRALETPDGLRLAPFDPTIDEALRVAHNEAFRDHWAALPRDPESWKTHVTGSRSFRPEVSYVVLDGDTVAAYALGYEWAADTEATGVREVYVGQVGTRREYRGRGLARAALAKVLAEGARAGYQRASLGVDADNPTGALGLYESLGFSVHSKWITFRRAL